MMKRDLRNRSLDEFLAGAISVDGTKAPPKDQPIGVKLGDGHLKPPR